MSTFSGRMEALADRMLAKFGQSITVNVNAYATGAQSWDKTPTATPHVIQAAPLNYEAAQMDGTNIQVGDRRYIVAAKDTQDGNGTPLFTFEVDKTEIVDGAFTGKVAHIKTERVQGVDISYEIQVR